MITMANQDSLKSTTEQQFVVDQPFAADQPSVLKQPAARGRNFLRPDFADLTPYDPGFVDAQVILSANENNFGIPARVHEQMQNALRKTLLNRYPDPLAHDLRSEIASWHAVNPQNVLLGNGGDELIFNLLLAFGGPRRKMLNCPPTFSIYALYAQLTGTKVVHVPRLPETFQLDTQAVAAAAQDCDLVFLTTPNNPTGDVIDREWIARFAAATPALVIVDEAYGDFLAAESSCIPLVSEHENLAVLRTLSKAFALAGARCGYLIASQSVIDGLAAVRQPYSVNVLTQAVAVTAVREREAFQPAISQIKAERERLREELSQINGVQVWPSAANFILVRLPNAHKIHKILQEKYSILVRDFSCSPSLANCLRISIGTPQENDQLIRAITEIITSQL